MNAIVNNCNLNHNCQANTTNIISSEDLTNNLGFGNNLPETTNRISPELYSAFWWIANSLNKTTFLFWNGEPKEDYLQFCSRELCNYSRTTRNKLIQHCAKAKRLVIGGLNTACPLSDFLEWFPSIEQIYLNSNEIEQLTPGRAVQIRDFIETHKNLTQLILVGNIFSLEHYSKFRDLLSYNRQLNLSFYGKCCGCEKIDLLNDNYLKSCGLSNYHCEICSEINAEL